MAGKVTIKSGKVQLCDDSFIGGPLDNYDQVTVPENKTLEVNEYIDRPSAILDGGGTLKVKKLTRKTETP